MHYAWIHWERDLLIFISTTRQQMSTAANHMGVLYRCIYVAGAAAAEIRHKVGSWGDWKVCKNRGVGPSFTTGPALTRQVNWDLTRGWAIRPGGGDIRNLVIFWDGLRVSPETVSENKKNTSREHGGWLMSIQTTTLARVDTRQHENAIQMCWQSTSWTSTPTAVNIQLELKLFLPVGQSETH